MGMENLRLGVAAPWVAGVMVASPRVLPRWHSLEGINSYRRLDGEL